MIDLSHLSEFVHLARFKMETVTSVLLSVREGDFLAPLDLKDAYFQSPIHPSSRGAIEVHVKRGRFTSSEPCVSGCRPLPKSSPGSLQPCQRGGTLTVSGRLVESCLFGAGSQAGRPVRGLLSICRTPGIVINEKKSDLVPSQTAKYLGMTIDTEAGKVFPFLARVEKFLTVAESFCVMDAPLAQLWQVILGHLASLERLVPPKKNVFSRKKQTKILFFSFLNI